MEIVIYPPDNVLPAPPGTDKQYAAAGSEHSVESPDARSHLVRSAEFGNHADVPPCASSDNPVER
jgi:hypothetical protein